MIGMSNTYTDYVNKIAITVPERYIDVKTGDSYTVSPKVAEQIEYHATNSSLSHLVLSALHQYLAPHSVLNGGTVEILQQLADIKEILENGVYTIKPLVQQRTAKDQTEASKLLNMKEVEDILEAFGG
jgi:1-aminocyclopropane-1-carboxylate deaminase/D-cysteine desulfhydrase-like pyridoxal-dependent ACC family enzyme